jgi:hypothetical protein
MPVVCCTCEVEMRLETAGVTVLEHARSEPYKLWQADRYECPICGNRIVTRFAHQALSEHFRADFQETLNAVEPDKLVHDYEVGSRPEKRIVGT